MIPDSEYSRNRPANRAGKSDRNESKRFLSPSTPLIIIPSCPILFQSRSKRNVLASARSDIALCQNASEHGSYAADDRNFHTRWTIMERSTALGLSQSLGKVWRRRAAVIIVSRSNVSISRRGEARAIYRREENQQAAGVRAAFSIFPSSHD